MRTQSSMKTHSVRTHVWGHTYSYIVVWGHIYSSMRKRLLQSYLQASTEGVTPPPRNGRQAERVFFFYLRLLALLVISAGLNRRRDTPPSEQQAGGKKRDRRFLRPLWVRIYMYMFFFFRQEDTKKRQALPSSSFDPCGWGYVIVTFTQP